MLDALATPWSGHRGLPLPTVLPSVTGVPPVALVDVTGGAAERGTPVVPRPREAGTALPAAATAGS